jgi:hypothetical protein
MDIARLVRDEVRWLARQEAPVADKLVATYQQSFLEIEQKLKSIKNPSGYTANQLRATQAQLGAIIETMHTQHSQLLGAHVKAIYKQQLPREGQAWATLEQTFGDPKLAKQFANITPAINQRAVRSLVTTQNISIKGFTADLQREVRSVLAIAHTRGETTDQMVARLKRIQGLPSCSPHRLRLIARMETARASNKAKIDHIKELQREFPHKEYWLMVKDAVDRSKTTRNHWLSWAISGTVRNVTKGEWFEVDTETLNATKAEYKRITGKKASDKGVLWKPGGVGRRGKTIPAHFWDRGVLVPWDPAWQGVAFGAFKHPQGPIIIEEPEPEPARPADPTPDAPVPPTLEPAEPARAQNELLPPGRPSARERLRARRLEQLVFEQKRAGIDFEALEFDEDFPAFLAQYQLKGGPLTRPGRATPWAFERQFAGLPHERAEIFTDAGKVLYSKDGTYNSLPFEWDELKPFRNQRFTHYHPEPLGFSDMDLINAIVCNFKELRVICPHQGEHVLFSIERRGGSWGKRGDDWSAGWRWTPADLVTLHDTYNSALLEQKEALAHTGLDPATLGLDATHYAVSQVCRLLNVRYRKTRLTDL